MTSDFGSYRKSAPGDKFLERSPPDSEILGGLGHLHEAGANNKGIVHCGLPTGLSRLVGGPSAPDLTTLPAIDPRSSSGGRSDAVASEFHGLRHPDCTVAAGSLRYSWRTFWSPALSVSPALAILSVTTQRATPTARLGVYSRRHPSFPSMVRRRSERRKLLILLGITDMESRPRTRVWIPGSACGGPGMTVC
jgi:hypothetical protein